MASMQCQFPGIEKIWTYLDNDSTHYDSTRAAFFAAARAFDRQG